MQKPRIETISEKKLIGHVIDMSLTNNKTFELFSGFMPLRNQVTNSISSDIYEVMIYEHMHFKNFDINKSFQKWATAEVSDFKNVPEGMSTLIIEKGLYAIFKFKGLPVQFGVLMNYVLTKWLPQSKYQLDTRPHFNVLGDAYKTNDPESEEDVYIPIKEK